MLRNITYEANIPYQHSTVFPFEQGLDTHKIRESYKAGWHYTIVIGFAYLAGIKLLESYMRSREAVKCRTQLVLWNGALAVFSIFGLFRSFEEMYHVLTQHSFYNSICYSYHQDNVAAYWFMFFSLSKIWELGDTVFLVLRKRHLSFLHCYHHITVLIYTFQSGSENLAAGRWFICMNFVAHSVMYSYYTVTSMGYRPPKFISVSVTLIQICQMVGGVLISCIVLGLKLFTSYTCNQTPFNLCLCFSIYVSYFILFVKFFNKAYLQKNSKKVE